MVADLSTGDAGRVRSELGPGGPTQTVANGAPRLARRRYGSPTLARTNLQTAENHCKAPTDRPPLAHVARHPARTARSHRRPTSAVSRSCASAVKTAHVQATVGSAQGRRDEASPATRRASGKWFRRAPTAPNGGAPLSLSRTPTGTVRLTECCPPSRVRRRGRRRGDCPSSRSTDGTSVRVGYLGRMGSAPRSSVAGVFEARVDAKAVRFRPATLAAWAARSDVADAVSDPSRLSRVADGRGRVRRRSAARCPCRTRSVADAEFLGVEGAVLGRACSSGKWR